MPWCVSLLASFAGEASLTTKMGVNIPPITSIASITCSTLAEIHSIRNVAGIFQSSLSSNGPPSCDTGGSGSSSCEAHFGRGRPPSSSPVVRSLPLCCTGVPSIIATAASLAAPFSGVAGSCSQNMSSSSSCCVEEASSDLSSPGISGLHFLACFCTALSGVSSNNLFAFSFSLVLPILF